MINTKLRSEIENILYIKNPFLEEENQRTLHAIKEEYLHLADYLDVPLGGLMSKEKIIQEAEHKFQKDKATFRKNFDTLNSDDKIKRASDLAGKELTEYVLMRNKIISELKEQIKDEEKAERKLHKLLMPQGYDSDTSSNKYIDPKHNNIWIIDDKFMSYSYAASDKTIATVLDKVLGTSTKKGKADRPDILVFFQKEKENYNAVIIELKSIGASADAKFRGLRELRKYSRSFKDEEKINNIWYYLITKVDDEFKEELEEVEFKLLFSSKENIYFKYYQKLSLYLYVISIEALVADAQARNETFLDIIKKNMKKNYNVAHEKELKFHF